MDDGGDWDGKRSPRVQQEAQQPQQKLKRACHHRPTMIVLLLAAIAVTVVGLCSGSAALFLLLPGRLFLPFFGLSSGTPSELPYYGRSPPVYPSPRGTGASSPAWAAAYARAAALVAQMTLEEKVNLTYGWPGPCPGNSGTVPRLGLLESLCFADGPAGVRGRPFASAFPAGIHLAATFDVGLMRRYGAAVSREFIDQGVHVLLGPVAGPLGRIARGGRNWEGFGSDPYLAGRAAGAVTGGMVSGEGEGESERRRIVATPKHFLLNEQEFRRRQSAIQNDGIPGEAVSANVDDRTLHELYAFPFMDALAAGAGAVMCSYQRANHSYGCQNAKLLNGVLKTELGFEGFVVSDWDGQHAGVAAALAGLDVAMPASRGFWADGRLVEAVRNGSVPAARVDDMATRLLAALWVGSEAAARAAPPTPPLPPPSHRALIREIGAAGTVLVKNISPAMAGDRGSPALPLRNPRFLCVYGHDAELPPAPWANPDRFGGGYGVNTGWATFNGTLVTGGGSGATTPPYVVSPFAALQERVVGGGGMLRWDFVSDEPQVLAYTHPAHGAAADACLVFINAYASETFDRPGLADARSDALVRHVADRCPNTIVIVHAAGIRLVDAWVDHANVTAVLLAGLPGQESGHSLVDVLYGDVSPSGRLPYTVARREADYGALLNSSVSAAYFPDDDFAEGLYVDYRAFDRAGAPAPRFPFGFGLSYTSFAYGGLAVAFVARNGSATEFPDPAVPIVQGGHPDLWAPVAEVRCRLRNSGAVAGHEVAQLYVGVPGADADGDAAAEGHTDTDTPVRQLRGFHRLALAPGESADAVFLLTRRDLSVWDVAAQQWRLRRGTYRLYVGASSRDLRANGTLIMGSAA